MISLGIVCVWERERDRERKGGRETQAPRHEWPLEIGKEGTPPPPPFKILWIESGGSRKSRHLFVWLPLWGVFQTTDDLSACDAASEVSTSVSATDEGFSPERFSWGQWTRGCNFWLVARLARPVFYWLACFFSSWAKSSASWPSAVSHLLLTALI